MRMYAAGALGKIGEKASAAIPALISALRDKYRGVRGNAAWALGKIGEKAEAAVPELEKLLKTAKGYEKKWIKEALKKIRGKTK